MVSVDFSIAIALYLFAFIVGLLLVWIFSKKEKNQDLTLDPKHIWFCSVCTYNYVNTKEELISACPRCGSYNKK